MQPNGASRTLYKAHLEEGEGEPMMEIQQGQLVRAEAVLILQLLQERLDKEILEDQEYLLGVEEGEEQEQQEHPPR